MMIFGFLKIEAQEIVTLKKGVIIENPIKGTYFKVSDEVKDKYEGIWAFDSGTMSFKIKLEFNKTSVEEFYIDNLNGYYCYKNNDCNSYESRNVINGAGSTFSLVNENKVKFMLYDSKNSKQINALFELLDDGSASWILTEREGIRLVKSDEEKQKVGFSIPTNIILTKGD